MTPLRKPRCTRAETVIRIFRGAPPVDREQFFEELDDLFDQDFTPRG